ncbi:MAG: RIP metalloprotease RseP [Tabrizicola sp.]|nr:RIP metalloprotease RseP [Tabrizicola sp.]
MDILAAFGGAAWAVFFFVVAMSIIVFVHEFGHYIIGRWSGIHAEVFSLGFGPVLWSRPDGRGTRWQVAAIPFGGYVKFLGDTDASSVRQDGVEGLSAAERRHTMSGAPLWARASTVAAGPIFNFILTFVVLAGLLAFTGIPTTEPRVGHIAPLPFDGPTLQEGDLILAINGQPTPDYQSLSDIGKALPPMPVVEYKVLRDGKEITVPGPHPQTPIISSVQIQSAAIDAGIRTGDVVIKANGQDIAKFDQLPDIVAAGKGAPMPLTIWRDGKTFDLTLTPRVRDLPKGDTFEQRWLIGLTGGLVFEPATRSTGPIETLQIAGQQMWAMVTGTFSALWHLVAGKISSCNMAGPIGMAESMGDAATNGAESFITLLAVLSLGVGILNLFPIPVLDGGHLVFHAYEAVAGRPPSDRALRVLMSVGLAIIVSLMAFALSNDILCV